ncbi:MAG TPA: STAS domain-containing protein [Armatimonadota bacterium]|nr:STAS domain-containing protein [Armatimonadota bacterium]
MIKLRTVYTKIPVVYVDGRIVGDDANNLKSTLLDLADRGYDTVALELGEAHEIDSSGIGALLATRGRLAQIGGSMSLVNCSGQLLEDLQNTGVTDLFVCYDRLQDVLNPS